MIERILVAVDDSSSTLEITESGTASGYRVYDGQGATIDVAGSEPYDITIDASYVIVRNLNLRGATDDAIRIFGGTDIVVTALAQIVRLVDEAHKAGAIIYLHNSEVSVPYLLSEADLATAAGRRQYRTNRRRVFKPAAILGRKECPYRLRRVVVWDAANEREIVLLTNHLEFAASTIGLRRTKRRPSIALDRVGRSVERSGSRT